MSGTDSDEIPDWLRKHSQTPHKTFQASSDSDDDIPLKVAAKPSQAPSEQRLPAAEAKAAAPPGAAKAAAAKAPAARTAPRPLASLQDGAGGEAGPSSQVDGAMPSQLTAQRGADGGVSIASQLGSKSEVAIMLPEKLPRVKVLVELVAASDDRHGDSAATDLSGDAGAVGRVIVNGKADIDVRVLNVHAGSEELQIDLKGIIYNATVLPLACTAMVLNIGPTEAKVETLCNDFIRLKEAPNEHGDEDQGGNLAHLLDGDDENYQIAGGVDDDDGAQKAAKKKKKAKEKEDGGGKAAGAKRKALAVKGGVAKRKPSAGKKGGPAKKKAPGKGGKK